MEQTKEEGMGENQREREKELYFLIEVNAGNSCTLCVKSAFEGGN